MSSEPIRGRSQEESHPSVTTDGHHMWNQTTKPFRAEFDLKNKTIEKYICDQCLDEFLHESSLTSHLDRRSLVLTYFCDHCNQRLIFFNRCALLSHIRSHICDNTPIDTILAKVVARPIDLNQLFPNETNIVKDKQNGKQINDKNIEPLPTDPKCVSIPPIKRPTKKLQVIRPERKKSLNVINDSIDTKYIIKKVNNSELKCCQCKCSFNSLWTREQHLADKQLVLPLNQCRLCPAICATNCSLSLHNGLHGDTDVNDVICPECGTKLNDNDVKQILTHIVVECLHLSRRLLYICMYCSEKMSTLSDFIQHIKSFHTNRQFQCRECQYIFKDETYFGEHQTHSHSNASEALILFKCPVCGTEFNSLNNYSFHLTTHRKKFLDFTSFIFVCLECDRSFATKLDLRSHINIDHIKDKTEIQKKDYLKHLTQDIAIKFKLKSNFSSDNTSDAFKVKNNIAINKNSKVSDNSSEKLFESNDLVTKRIKIVDKKDIKTLGHVKSDPQNNPQLNVNDNWFECRECGLSFPFVQTLKRHLILEHRIHDVESYINMTYIKIPIAPNASQFPKEVGEEKLSQIMTDGEHSTDTLCPICSQKFSNTKELKIHGRVHGLAFIKSCQRKNLSLN